MWLFLALSAGWYLNENLREQLPGIGDTPSDFTHYYQAARHVAQGLSPYSDSSYDYPPAVAFALTPLARMDYVTARRIWFAASHLFLLLAAWVMWRAVGGGLLAACSVAFVWAFGGAAGESLSLGQLGPLLVLLLALAYTRASAAQGIPVGMGLALKLIPGLLVVAILLRRDWRAMAGLAATVVVAALVPSAAIAHWNARQAYPVRADYWMGTPAILSWSVPSAVLRMLDPPRRGDKLPHGWEFGNGPEGAELSRARRLLSVSVAAGILLAGIGALVLACRGKLRADQVPWAAAALISLGVAASPISWTHYQVLQYPGLALLLHHALRRRAWMLSGATLVLGGLLYPLPVAVLRAYYRQFGAWTAASPATLYVWTSVAPLAALVLFGVLLWQVKRAVEPRPAR
jgi:alpha-1,2-mannosyltransferase